MWASRGSERLVLTCGATHALHLVSSQLFGGGGLCVVEEPSYYLALGLLKDDLGMRLVPGESLQSGLENRRL